MEWSWVCSWHTWQYCGTYERVLGILSVLRAVGWLHPADNSPLDYSHDEYNNWVTDLPTNLYNGTMAPVNWDNDTGGAGFITQQLWIQTADQGMVCIMGNASFDVGYEFVDGAQTVAEYSISMFEPFWTPPISFWGLLTSNSTMTL